VARGRGKYCSQACYKESFLEERLCQCGTKFKTKKGKRGRKTCSNRCAKSRVLSEETRDKISNTLSRGEHQKKRGKYTKKCHRCKTLFETYSSKSRLCGSCKQSKKCKVCNRDLVQKECVWCKKAVSQKPLPKRCRNKRGAKLLVEILNLTQDNNQQLCEDLGVDFVVGKLAIEYQNPKYPYSTDNDHEDQLMSRGFVPHPISWSLEGEPDSKERLRLEADIIDFCAANDNPFVFTYDKIAFQDQYARLQKTTSLKGFCYCRTAMEWYHKHLWTMKTSRAEVDPISYWRCNPAKITANRIKYANLSPTSLRRYFKLFDMVPTMFQDSLGKRMALMVDGPEIVDPFAGFGGRMLGACAIGKTYTGFDINPWTCSANVIMAKEMGLTGVRIHHADSSQMDPVECDGVITSPPFFNKDEYGDGGYDSLEQYQRAIHETFKRITLRDKAILDFKPVQGCSLDDFVAALPYRVQKIEEVNFGGLGRKSIHHWVVAC